MMDKRTLNKFTQIHQTLLLRFAIVMAIYTVSRVLFYLINADLFSETTYKGLLIIMGGGIRFDLSALLFINALYILSQLIPFRFRYKIIYQKITNYFFLVTNSVFVAINTGDIIYYRFIFKRTTGSVIDNFAQETNLGKLFFRFIFIDYWYLTILFIALVWLMSWLFKKTYVVKPGVQKRWIYYPVQSILMLMLVYFSIIGMRGGFTGTTRPITLNNAGRYVERPKEMALVLNTPFSIFKTFGKQTFNKVDYLNDKDLDRIYTPIHRPNPGESFKNKNVVIFIIESLGKEYIGALNNDSDSS
ncbi:MAG: LTA synthase family protein, partial [Bacteroidota bacterium]